MLIEGPGFWSGLIKLLMWLLVLFVVINRISLAIVSIGIDDFE